MAASELFLHDTYSVYTGTACIDGLDIFYRDAGTRTGPVIVLLHGAVSSDIFQNLLPRLEGFFRLVAPDFPGYGRSSAPKHTELAYSYENFVKLADRFVEELRLSRYSLYLMDYGAPVGYRLAPSRTAVSVRPVRNQRRDKRRPLAPWLREETHRVKYTFYSKIKPVSNW